jgi:hypothetical protein
MIYIKENMEITDIFIKDIVYYYMRFKHDIYKREHGNNRYI